MRRNRGFTLVEAMVALIVLSVGLLGIAALYVETLRANRTSLYRTQAVNMATDIGDRMRSNRNPAAAYACGSPCDLMQVVEHRPVALVAADALHRPDGGRQRHRHRRPHRLDEPDCGAIARRQCGCDLYRANGDDAHFVRRRRELGRTRPGRSSDLPAPDRDLRTPQ